jgi:hypothetical protein
MVPRPDVERIPGDLDRFLGGFFSRRGWRSEIKFDPSENLLYLVVRLGDRRLSMDDRFFSLVEHFVRAQSALLQKSRGPSLRCRLIDVDGRDLTRELHDRGSRLLDEGESGSRLRRRITLLRLRRRAVRSLGPNALLWAAAFTFVVAIVGLPFGLAVWLGAAALLVQIAVLALLSGRGP